MHKNNKSFEDIKHSDENGIEFWYARELMPVLQYSNWQNFEKIINKAKISCENSDISVLDHFIDVSKMVQKSFFQMSYCIIQKKTKNIAI